MKTSTSRLLLPSLLVALAAAPREARAVTADFGQALSLSGSNYYDTGSQPFDPSLSTFTAECWFKATGGTTNARLISQMAGTGTGRSWLYLYNGKLATLLGGTTIAGQTTVTTNAWHHAAIVHDRAAHRVTLYLDGAVDAVGTVFAESATGNVVLGVNPAITGAYFTGQVDEVRIWTRARGKYEIQKDMHLALKGNESKLKAYYNFNDTATSMRAASSKTGFSTIVWNGSVTGVLPGGDTAGNTLTYAITKQGSRGTTTVDSSTGKFTYTVTSTTYGTDTVTYSVAAGGTTVTQTLTVYVGRIVPYFTRLSSTSNPLYGMNGSVDRTFIKFVDIDKDGDQDAYAYTSTGEVLGFYTNQGTAYSPSFVKTSTTGSPIPSEYYCRNGTWSYSINATCKYYCTTSGTQVCEDTFDYAPYLKMDFVDANRDGDWDFFSVLAGTEKSLQLYQNTGSATSASYTLSSDTWFYSLPTISSVTDFFMADIDESGFAAAVFVTPNASASHPLSYKANALDFRWGSPTSDILQSNFTTGTSAVTPWYAGIGDLNGDGAWDVVTGGWSQVYPDIYLNSGSAASPSFSSPITPYTSTSTTGFYAAPVLVDLDGDGDLDIAAGGYLSDGFSYYRNDTAFSYNQVSASSLTLSIQGNIALGYYTFDGTGESGSTYEFQRADSDGGTSTTIASGTATGSSLNNYYTLTGDDNTKYIRFCVTVSDGLSTASQSCTTWTSVGHLVQMYKDASYGSTSAAIAYEKSSWGNCFNLSSYSLDNMVSSLKFYGASGGPSTLWIYLDANCSGTSATYTLAANGSFLCTSVSSCYSSTSWNDSISSFRVTW